MSLPTELFWPRSLVMLSYHSYHHTLLRMLDAFLIDKHLERTMHRDCAHTAHTRPNAFFVSFVGVDILCNACAVQLRLCVDCGHCYTISIPLLACALWRRHR